MLRHSRFDPDEIEREKGVIVEEMNMYFDTPRDYIGGVYDDLLYGDQPLGWDIIGRKETVRGATRETFTDYLDHWYKPSRMVLGMAGRIGDDALERAQQLLGDLAPGDTGEPAPAQAYANGRVKVFTKQSDQAHLCLGVHSYPLTHPDRYALQLLATVLGGGMSSRLFTEVRERRGLAYYVFGFNHSYTDAGSLYSQAGVDITRIDEAVTTIAGELRKAAAEPIPAEELEKARNFAKGRFVLGLESPQGLIVFGLRKEVLEGRAPGSGGGARRARRGHRRGRAARRPRPAARRAAPARRDRPVRRRRPLRSAARLAAAQPAIVARSASSSALSSSSAIFAPSTRARSSQCAASAGSPASACARASASHANGRSNSAIASGSASQNARQRRAWWRAGSARPSTA